MRKIEEKSDDSLLEFKTRLAIAKMKYKVDAYLFKTGLFRDRNGKLIPIRERKATNDTLIND